MRSNPLSGWAGALSGVALVGSGPLVCASRFANGLGGARLGAGAITERPAQTWQALPSRAGVRSHPCAGRPGSGSAARQRGSKCRPPWLSARTRRQVPIRYGQDDS
jgi:hypothetical protein